MHFISKIFAVILFTFVVLSCTACSGLDTLSESLKGGVQQLGNDVAIGKSNALVNPYQSFEGSRMSDNFAFQATYDAAVTGFNGQDILVANTELKGKACRELVIDYNFTTSSGNCQLIYISPDLDETVCAENGNGSVRVQLQLGANYIGIRGTDYSGSIQIKVE